MKTVVYIYDDAVSHDSVEMYAAAVENKLKYLYGEPFSFEKEPLCFEGGKTMFLDSLSSVVFAVSRADLVVIGKCTTSWDKLFNGIAGMFKFFASAKKLSDIETWVQSKEDLEKRGMLKSREEA